MQQHPSGNTAGAEGIIGPVCKFYLRKAFFAACLAASLFCAYESGVERERVRADAICNPTPR